MASSKATRRVDIPLALYWRLEAVARDLGVPTSQLCGTWLWQQLAIASKDLDHPASRHLLVDHPYRIGVRSYPRRDG